jgi:hypothetical protein
MADAPSPGGKSRLVLSGAALLGAAAVGIAWLVTGTTGNSSVSTSLDTLAQAPAVAPPDYAYLDTAAVALYLGQLQGGLATSEQLSEQLSKGRSASLGAGGLSLGGSTASSSTAERVVTPTATSSFYQLLDLLGRDGYLHTVDATESPAKLRHAFAGIPEGSFVELQNCTIQIPSYVTLEELSRASTGNQSPLAIYLSATQSIAQTFGSSPTSYQELLEALHAAGRARKGTGIPAAFVRFTPQEQRRLGRAIRALDKSVGTDPRVPLSTCDGGTDYKPRGVDLLFPIQLADLSSEQSLLAGPVTVVGKLVRAVRNQGEDYVDEASFATFVGPTSRIDRAAPQLDEKGLYEELDADAVVLNPGAVILPIAIYK